MLEPSGFKAPNPFQISSDFLGTGYRTLKVTEATVFALAPLPLQHIKSGIQQVAVPLLVTAAASRVPGVDQLLNGGIHAGGQFLAAGGKAIATQGLSTFGQAVTAHLPTGLGARSLAGGIGQAVSPVVLGGVEQGGRVLGEVSTAILSGRTIINAAQQLSSNIRDKGIKVYIGDAIANTQAVISSTQAFLSRKRFQVSNLLKGEFTMAPRNNGKSGDETSAQISGDNEARQQYVKYLQAGLEDPSLTYEKLAKEIAAEPKVGPLFDKIAINQALGQGKSADVSTQVVAQGPHVQKLINSDQQQNVSGYLAEAHNYHLAEQERIDKSITNGKQKESGPQQPTHKQVEGQQSPTTIQSHQNGKNVPQQPGKPLEQANSITHEAAAPTNSREAEDYALGIVQMLDQRRLNVDRFQIDVNGKTVFKMRDGDINQEQTSITNKHTELVKKALSDPASLKGSVKISQGNQVLLHVKDGRVLIDAVGISKQSAKVEVKTPDSPAEGLYERFSKEVNSSGLQATKDIATNALKAGVKREEVIEMLKSHDPSYQRLSSAQGDRGASQTMEKMVSAAEGKLMQESIQQPQQAQAAKASRSMKA